MSAATMTRPAVLPNRRQQLEDAVERALAALDALDGDPDLEADCDDDWDRSDLEASFCGVSFGWGRHDGHDGERDGPAFLMDQRETEAGR